MMKKLTSSMIEKKGVNYIRSIVENSNCIFNEIPKQNDFGNDAFIELVDGESVTGISIALQIKSGKSYCRKRNCSIPSNYNHFKYWSNHSLPIVGIVYDPDENSAYWINISTYLNNNIELVKNGPFRISIPKNELHKFNKFGFKTFFLKCFLKKPIVLSFNKSIEYLNSTSSQMTSIGLSSLFYGHRNNPKTWRIFEKIIKTWNVDSINPKLVWYLAHIPGHGDIFWHERNIINESLRKKVLQKISHFDKAIIIKLLGFVDDNGFSRGTIGQNVHALISANYKNENILHSIIIDKDVIESRRINALILYSYILQTKAEGLLESICKDQTLIKNKSELVLVAGKLLSNFEQYGFIGFY